MKKVKFRAWDKKTKKIRNKIILINFSDEYILIAEDEALSFDEVELMQSTGLKDKNGKEIYEGDIVRWKDLESFDDFPIDEVFKVEYSDEFMKWVACYKNNLKDDLYDFTDNRDLEVIGNIYENKELLND